MNDQATTARETAERSRRDGRTVETTPDPVPIAVFTAPKQHPELTVHLGEELTVQFHNGQLAIHDQKIAEQLQAIADDHDITVINSGALSTA